MELIMKKAIIYGAGNIGRGFLGQLLNESGYEVVFIDVNAQVVDGINRERCYPIKIVSDAGNEEIMIDNVRAVNGLDMASVMKEISDADIMFTAVGVNVLPYIAEPLAKGLAQRWNSGNMTPLNIIICENLISADSHLKALVNEAMKALVTVHVDEDLLETLVGFVLASIGRMVPVMTPEMQGDNPLRVCVEAYKKLPVDLDAIKGDLPEVVNMIPFSPFDYYIHRKLYIHNMGHAITAYLGALSDYTYIWEAVNDLSIKEVVKEAMLASVKALSIEHKMDFATLALDVDDLIIRFGNKQLGDSIERVGRDLERKLASNDRLIGTLTMCLKHDVGVQGIVTGIASALLFKDSLESQTTQWLEAGNIEQVLSELCCIEAETKVSKMIIEARNSLA